MANSDKNLVIVPNVGSSTGDPTITFSGADSSLGAQSLQARIYPTSNGTLSFEGSAGQLFSITNSLTGTIYSVNDVSGLPSIEVLDTGVVRLARYSGRVIIGNIADNGNDSLQFAIGTSISLPNINSTGNVTAIRYTSNVATGTAPFTVSSTTTVANLSADKVDGVDIGTLTAAGGIAYATSTSALAATGAGTSGQAVISGGAGAPTFQTVASANGASTIVARDGAGSFTGNIITATTFSGSGASLTNIPNSATTAASANGASTIVARDAAGSFTANQINASLLNISSTADTATAASHYFVETSSDGAIRPKTLANAQAEIVTAATVNAIAIVSGSTTQSVVRYGGTTAVAGQFDGGTTNPSGTTRLNYGGYLYATRFYGDGSQLTSLPAGQLSGTIPSAVLGNSSLNIGTTSVALNRASSNLGLAGITSITGGTGTTAISLSSAATTSAASGGVSISSGATSTSGVSGDVSIFSGSTPADSTSGNIQIYTSQSAGSGTGSDSGQISIYSGAAAYNGSATARNSGSVSLYSGFSHRGNSGIVYIYSGQAAIGTSGNVQIAAGTSTSTSASGAVTVNGGQNTSTGAGGSVTVKGGDNSSSTTSATGGAVFIYGGSTSSTAAITKTTGSIWIEGGGTGSGGTINYGSVYIGTQGTSAQFGTGSVNIGRPGITTTIDGTFRISNGAAAGRLLQSDASGNVSWVTPPGATITNDTATNADTFYPGMTSNQTSGSWTSAIVSNTKLYFNPSTGQLNATNFNSLSDATKKENVKTIENATEKTLALRGVTFDWIDTKKGSLGVIAQEVEQIVPDAVSTSSSGEKSVNYGSLVGLLIETIKEQNARIEALEAIIAAK